MRVLSNSNCCVSGALGKGSKPKVCSVLKGSSSKPKEALSKVTCWGVDTLWRLDGDEGGARARRGLHLGVVLYVCL